MFSVVVAADRKRGIGQGGQLPWKLRGDMRYFRELTTCPDPAAVHARYRMDQAFKDKRRFTWETLVARLAEGPHRGESAAATAQGDLPAPGPAVRNAVLMGRKTWDSLPARFRPLPDRVNGVLSRGLAAGDAGTHRVWNSLDQALTDLAHDASVANVFVAGGGEIFAEALRRPDCARLYLTDIDAAFACDTFLADPGPAFVETASSPILEEAGVAYRFRLLEKEFSLKGRAMP